MVWVGTGPKYKLEKGFGGVTNEFAFSKSRPFCAKQNDGFALIKKKTRFPQEWLK